MGFTSLTVFTFERKDFSSHESKIKVLGDDDSHFVWEKYLCAIFQIFQIPKVVIFAQMSEIKK